MNRPLATISLALVLVLAGCASLGGGTADSSQLSHQSEGGGAVDRSGVPGVGGSSTAAGEIAGGPAQTNRAIVRNGTLRLRVDNFSTARSALVSHARSLDGYTSGSEATRHTEDDTSWRTGTVVVRVPSDRYDDMVAFARDRGTVRNEETRTTDVTDQLVDLRARLNNSRERRTRLRTFYQRANTTEDLLDVEERLSDVQAEIERLQATLESLEDRVAYSTIRIHLEESPPETPAAGESRGASLASAFVGSTITAIDYAYGTVVFVVRLVPYLIVFGLPVVVVARLTRRRYGSVRAAPVLRAFGTSGSSGRSQSAERSQPPDESADESENGA